MIYELDNDLNKALNENKSISESFENVIELNMTQGKLIAKLRREIESKGIVFFKNNLKKGNLFVK